MKHSFEELTSTFQSTISGWSYYCDFDKIEKNAFSIKVQLNILNSLLGEQNIESKFLEIIKNYPKTREVLPILLAVRERFTVIWDKEKNIEEDVSKLFNPDTQLQDNEEEQLLKFFHESGLKNIFQDKKISNLNDYVFGIETGLDSNARKSRSGRQMEDLIESYISKFCDSKGYCWKSQATLKYILETWGINIQNNKTDRRFDFAIYTGNSVYLIETNFFSGGGSKLKAVSGEFTELYLFLKKQDKQLYWFTDGAGWKTSKRSLEEAFNAMEGNIYNIKDLNDGILGEIIK